MKYIRYTYVDAVTGIPVTDAPAENGPAFPDVDGLEFVWARESCYPTDVPEFFGTCPDDAFAMVPGVLDVLTQADWETMQADEMRARDPVPAAITMRQCRLQLLAIGKLADVDAAIASLPGPQKEAAQIEWEYAATVERSSPLVEMLAAALELDADALFREGAKL